MKTHCLLIASSLLAVFAAGCAGKRMHVLTSTSIGLNATPGDGSVTPPQVSLAYKRTEATVIPTNGNPGRKATSWDDDADTLSAFGLFRFHSGWFFKPTRIDQFLATGHAARDLQSNPHFMSQLADRVTTDRQISSLLEQLRAELAKTHGAASNEGQ